MKTWSRALPAVLAVLLVAASVASAQQRQRMTPQQRTDTLASQLSLNDDQKAKVLQIFTAADDSMRAAFASHQGDRSSMREAMQGIRQDTDTKMKAVLTDDQYASWQKMRTGMGMRGGRRGMNGGGN